MNNRSAPGRDRPADLILHPRWMLPIEPDHQVLHHHALVIAEGRIVALLPEEQARVLPCAERLELPEHALLPGLVNAHGHAAMSLLRGHADDLALDTWLQEHIWPLEQRWVSAEFVHDGVQLALAEMLRSGTTCFSDMYFFPDVAARAAVAAGMRAQVAFPILEMPSAWGRDADDYLSRGLQVLDDFRHSELVEVALGPHAPYTVGDAALRRTATLAAELDAGIQIHVHETLREVEQSLAEHGQRPLARLERLGLLGPRTQCVHGVFLDAEDRALLSARGSHVIHCPRSNLKLASGLAPVATLLDEGINVALGTDGAASSNGLSLFDELQLAALLAKAVTGQATALPAAQALHMATLAGARALGLEERIGSLVPGKQADLIAVDLSGPEHQPVHQPLSQLVYTAAGRAVSHVWVAGRPLMRERQLTTLDLPAILGRAENWRQKLAAPTRQR